MTIIKTIYSQEPDFPPEDQHPDAKRFKIGEVWVDAIGDKPTQQQVSDFLNPPAAIWAEYQGRAKAALAASDITVTRCLENAAPVPAAWRTYRSALRAIVGATSGDAGESLPMQPAFPPNT